MEENPTNNERISKWILGVMASAVILGGGWAINSQMTLGEVRQASKHSADEILLISATIDRIENRVIKLETRDEEGTPRSQARKELEELGNLVKELSSKVDKLTIDVRGQGRGGGVKPRVFSD